jgi:hypothetical protein
MSSFKINTNFSRVSRVGISSFIQSIINASANTEDNMLIYKNGKWDFKTNSELFEQGKLDTSTAKFNDSRQIILTFSNPQYNFTLSGFTELVLNDLDSNILDITGETIQGVLSFPFVDSPEEAKIIIDQLKLRPSSPSTVFCFSREHGTDISDILIKTSSFTSRYIKLSRMTSQVEEEESNQILIWNKEKGDNDDKFYFIITAIDFTEGSEKIKITANQKGENINNIVHTKYSSQKLFDVKSFIQNLQYEYPHNNWSVFGKLEGLYDTYSVNINLQKLNIINTPFHNKPNYIFYMGFDKKGDTTSWVNRAAVCNIKNPTISVDKDASPPIHWVVSTKSNLLVGEEQYVSIELLDDDFGEINSRYKITAVGLGINKDLIIEIIVIDRLGIVKQGLGENSFFPNWLESHQRSKVLESYNGSLFQYLRNNFTTDDLSSQGSYYFSLPLLQVIDFTIVSIIDGRIDTIDLTKNSSVWMDKITQSFKDNSSVILSNLKYNFFALSFFDINACMTISQITTSNGVLHSATFSKEGQSNINWDIDKIIIVGTEQVTVEETSFYTKWNIVLSNPDAIIQVRAEWNEQINHISKYFEGSAVIDLALINGATLNNGLCWMEISNN